MRKGFEVNSVKDFIAYAKANPGKLNYASSGNGSTIHLSAELFKRMTGVDMNHIPYRGSAPAVNDLVAGQVDLMFDNATSIIGQVRGGTVQALGVTSLERSPLLPDLPTVAETVAGYDTASWFGIGVRAGTPEEIIETIEQAVRTVTQEAIVKERMAAVIADPVVSDRKSVRRVRRRRAQEVGHAHQRSEDQGGVAPSRVRVSSAPSPARDLSVARSPSPACGGGIGWGLTTAVR